MTVLHMHCVEGMRMFPDNTFDSIVTDPPYELGFMGKSWDSTGIAYSVEMWREALRVLKPGGHLLSFGGSRTYHRMACAIEDAGFDIRDQIMWIYGSGFPKSLDVGKAIDKAEDYKLQAAKRRAYVEAVQEAGLTLPGNSHHDWTVGEHAPGDKWWREFEAWLPGLSDVQRHKIERIVTGKGFKPRPTYHTEGIGGRAEANEYDITAPATDAARQWDGWGTALKPAHEPICVARKPLIGTVAANVLAHGTGALNIDGCRVGNEVRVTAGMSSLGVMHDDDWLPGKIETVSEGRWPANLIHDGSDEVLAAFPQSVSGGALRPEHNVKTTTGWSGGSSADRVKQDFERDTGSAARFFYCAKASKKDRGEGNTHPTVKPTDLMRYLVRLVTPPGGTVLDPFAGSGSTFKAATAEGFDFMGFELQAEYVALANARGRLTA